MGRNIKYSASELTKKDGIIDTIVIGFIGAIKDK